jgi:uncharacterized protein (DUF433 family)
LGPNPKSGSKQLFVKGTRIRARLLYGWYSCAEPRTPEEIAVDYDLPVEAVKEAILYCQSNPPELQEDRSREDALIDATGMNEPDYKYRGQPRLLSPQERTRILHS